jgi:hypothetical protein
MMSTVHLPRRDDVVDVLRHDLIEIRVIDIGKRQKDKLPWDVVGMHGQWLWRHALVRD